MFSGAAGHGRRKRGGNVSRKDNKISDMEDRLNNLIRYITNLQTDILGRLLKLEHPDPAPEYPPDYHPCCKCWAGWDWGMVMRIENKRCPVHGKKNGPAPECKSPHKGRRGFDYLDEKGQIRHVDMGEVPDPAPPLHARVAKELGKEVIFNDPGEWRIKDDRYLYLLPIPPYDKDRDLAIHWTNTDLHSGWQVQIGNVRTIFKSLARAICEAICAHAEQQ
jgi:hypothetical protein